MFDINTLHGSLFLCEPLRLRQLVSQAVAIPCPTAREIAEARRLRLDEARLASARAVRAGKGRVGVIPIHGPIDQRLSAPLMKLGGTSTEEVGLAFDTLMMDSSVSSILLHVDSPGGYSYGVEELSDKIYGARGRKPIYAVADSMAASAAYWIYSAAETLAVTPGGDVGSVGVYAVHVDESKAMAAKGLAVTMVSAGKHKAEMAPHAPLSEEARGYLQETVDRQYDKFLMGLKRNRGLSLETVRRDFGQGRMVHAEAAVKAGMATRVMTFEDMLGRLMGQGASADDRKRVSTEILRLRHQQAKRRLGSATPRPLACEGMGGEDHFMPGDRVRVLAGAEHGAGDAGRLGTVMVLGGQALGIAWDDDPETIARWYTTAELESESPEEEMAEGGLEETG